MKMKPYDQFFNKQQAKNNRKHNKMDYKNKKNLYTLNKQEQDQSEHKYNDYDFKKQNAKRINSNSQSDSSRSSYSDYQMRARKKHQHIRNKKIQQVQKQGQLQNYEFSDSGQQQPNDNQINQQRIKKYDQQQPQFQHELKIKKLMQQKQILQNSLRTHQNRQKQLVHKFAKLECDNKKLQYHISKIEKSQKQNKIQQSKLKQLRKNILNDKQQNAFILKSIESQNLKLLHYLNGLIKILSQRNQATQGTQSSQVIHVISYIQKCIQNCKNSRIKSNNNSVDIKNKQNMSFQNNQMNKDLKSFDFNFKQEQISRLQNQKKRVHEQLIQSQQKNKQLLQKMKQIQIKYQKQKIIIIEKYNTSIELIKGKSQELIQKIQSQQQKYTDTICTLEKSITKKQQTIKKLKNQLKQMSLLNEQKLYTQQQSQIYYMPQKSIKNSKSKFISGDFIQQSFDSINHHEQSFYQNKKKSRKSSINMKKSKRIQYQQACDIYNEQKDLFKINQQIEMLQKEIFNQIQNHH